jgi:hypothetical protein
VIAFLEAFCSQHYLIGPCIIALVLGMFLQLLNNSYRNSLQFIVEMVHGHPPASTVHHHANEEEEV